MRDLIRFKFFSVSIFWQGYFIGGTVYFLLDHRRRTPCLMLMLMLRLISGFKRCQPDTSIMKLAKLRHLVSKQALLIDENWECLWQTGTCVILSTDFSRALFISNWFAFTPPSHNFYKSYIGKNLKSHTILIATAVPLSLPIFPSQEETTSTKK